MDIKKSIFAPLVAASGLAMLLSTAAIASPQPQDRDDYHFRADRISTQGEITNISREGDQYRVNLNHGTYTYFFPVSTIRNRDIRVGDRVRIGGVVSGDSVNADFIAFSGEPAYANDPSYRSVPYGSTGWMSGTVISVNRRLNYVTIRDDSSGLPVKMDVRNMDTKRSVNVWRTRAGDHISLMGSWSNRDTFTVSIVQY
ncbi:MAG TPA: hypothetical protein VLC46_08500 [Thermoanaerobaculia bacterium]|jgi:hypothetical protein|nr:hypothetical protein [Thermoanaerobaculia bacterium]